MNTTDFKKGDKVYFGRNFGEKTLGEVVKVNRVKLKIKQLEARGTYKSYPVGSLWTVPVSMCSKTDDDASGADSDLLTSDHPAKAPAPKRSEAEIIRDIRGVYAALSPENLSCDGELPRSAILRRSAALNSKLRALFVEMGRKVSESEAYGS